MKLFLTNMGTYPTNLFACPVFEIYLTGHMKGTSKFINTPTILFLVMISIRAFESFCSCLNVVGSDITLCLKRWKMLVAG